MSAARDPFGFTQHLEGGVLLGCQLRQAPRALPGHRVLPSHIDPTGRNLFELQQGGGSGGGGGGGSQEQGVLNRIKNGKVKNNNKIHENKNLVSKSSSDTIFLLNS